MTRPRHPPITSDSDSLGTILELVRAVTPAEMNEASLSRAWRRFMSANTSSFALMTSWRGGLPRDTNQQNFDALQQAVRAVGLGYVRLAGVWDGQSEPSLWVNGIDRAKAVALAKKYDQDAVVYAGPETEGHVELLDKDGKVITTFARFSPTAVSGGFSKLSGKPFYFEWEASDWGEAIAIKEMRRRFGKKSA